MSDETKQSYQSMPILKRKPLPPTVPRGPSMVEYKADNANSNSNQKESGLVSDWYLEGIRTTQSIRNKQIKMADQIN